MKKLSQQISGIVKSIVARKSNLSDRRRGRHSRVRRMAVQALEPRMLLAFDVVAAETMLVYLVNQTRANPEATAARLAISLPAGEIAAGRQPGAASRCSLAFRRHAGKQLPQSYWAQRQYAGGPCHSSGLPHRRRRRECSEYIEYRVDFRNVGGSRPHFERQLVQESGPPQ